MSRLYDLLAGSSEFRFIQMGLDNLSAGPGDTVLELGCGTGKALVELRRQVGNQGMVCGLDLSKGMLRMARSTLSKRNQINSTDLCCADGAFLPYASAIFTHLFMSFTLELFDTPEIPQVLAECRRVLVPGGRLSLVVMTVPVHSSLIVKLYEWFHDHFPVYVDCRPINAENLIQAAGFTINNQMIKAMWGLPVAVILAING